VYQIYPRTFKETRDVGERYTGQGNLRGIIAQRDYLVELGVDALWISPFYPSPLVDGGYDIADYEGVDPRLGTLEDFDKLVRAYHEVDIRIMIDLVPNHTSDQHEWFQEARSSRDNPKRDWYIWHDPAPNGGPPNNWSSVFSIPQLRARERGELIVPEGENTPPISAWEYDEASDQYYLRDFAAEQPNLNWQNPEVREAMKEVMRVWLRRDIDGFRVDVANHLGKDPDFRDEAPNPSYIEGADNPHDQHMQFHSLNYPPTLYPYLRELTSVMDEEEFADRDLRMILECWMDKKDLQKVDRVAPRTTSSFNFTRLRAPWNAATHRQLLGDYFTHLPPEAIGNQVLSNHDVSRVATRLGKDAARAAAVLNLTLPKVMNFIYNGEEGGFTDVVVPPARRKDSELGERDGARTPILWDNSPNAGFSQTEPGELWLPIDPDYETKNLAHQATDPLSFFSLYRTLLHFRHNSLPLQKGTYTPFPTDQSNILAFASRHENGQVTTLVNFSETHATPLVSGIQHALGRIVMSSTIPHRNDRILTSEPLTLRPLEAIVIVPAT
jgi:alpha-glucosidase